MGARIVELARRAAERYAAIHPECPLGNEWLATAFLADVAVCDGIEELWWFYRDVALRHHAALAADEIATRRIRPVRDNTTTATAPSNAR